jgi:hypothetical protein
LYFANQGLVPQTFHETFSAATSGRIIATGQKGIVVSIPAALAIINFVSGQAPTPPKAIMPFILLGIIANPPAIFPQFPDRALRQRSDVG